MSKVSLVLGLVAGLVLAATAATQEQDASDESKGRLKTLSGRTYLGTILSDDGETVEIKTMEGATIKLPYGQLTPKTQYRLRVVRTADDVDSQVALAEWCVDETLYTEAKRHFRAALEADALRADEINKLIVQARTKAGKELLARAKSLTAAKKPDEARKILSTIVQELPLEEVATKAATLLAADTEQRKASTFVPKTSPSNDDPTADGDTPKRRSGEEYSEAARAKFAPTIKAYHAMLDATQKGLVTTKQSASIKEFEKAIKDGEKARKEADKVRPQGEQDEEIAEALDLVDSKLEEAIVDSRIHLMNVYLMRGSYNQASEVVNKGLAEYPQNANLKQASAQVTSASTNNDIGGWVIRGRPGHVRHRGR